MRHARRTFEQWIHQARDRADATGDFARLWCRDRGRPRRVLSWGDIGDHLAALHADADTLAAAEAAWHAWRHAVGRDP